MKRGNFYEFGREISNFKLNRQGSTTRHSLFGATLTRTSDRQCKWRLQSCQKREGEEQGLRAASIFASKNRTSVSAVCRCNLASMDRLSLSKLEKFVLLASRSDRCLLPRFHSKPSARLDTFAGTYAHAHRESPRGRHSAGLYRSVCVCGCERVSQPS